MPVWIVIAQVSHNLVATGRASNHSNPCGTNFYPGCDKGQFFPPAARGEESSTKTKCGMEDCFFANRAISRVHTTGTDLRTMGQNAQGNQVVTQGTGPNDQLCKRKRCSAGSNLRSLSHVRACRRAGHISVFGRVARGGDGVPGGQL